MRLGDSCEDRDEGYSRPSLGFGKYDFGSVASASLMVLAEFYAYERVAQSTSRVVRNVWYGLVGSTL